MTNTVVPWTEQGSREDNVVDRVGGGGKVQLANYVFLPYYPRSAYLGKLSCNGNTRMYAQHGVPRLMPVQSRFDVTSIRIVRPKITK